MGAVVPASGGIDTADGKALLRWKGLVSHSRWAFRLKDRIDPRFMRRHGAETLLV